MRLPKRVPWSNPGELEQLCSWIYADEEDLASKVLAANRMAAWKASTALPHALESTLSLLMVILQDEGASSSPNAYSSTLALRQSYSLSLIRLVNGLVDPLQQGAYARPIASIAAQIGLPLWLVELRHASTHEELPSLELLREGSREAMSWILRNYFLPTVSPANQPANAPATFPPLSPLLAQYKQLLKTTTRDASLKSRSKPELVRILKDVEHWVVDAKVAASMVSFGTQEGEEDERERWALERLCEALVGRGGLVPVSKRKRPSPSQGLAVPNSQHVALWSPFILHVHSRYPAFPSILLSRMIAHVLSPRQAAPDPSAFHCNIPETSSLDPTYDQTLASWALWIVNRWSDEPGADCQRVDVVKDLLLGLGRGDRRAGRALVTALAENDPQLKESVVLLSTTLQSTSRISPWEDDTLKAMSVRLSSLRPDSKATENSVHEARHELEDVEMSAPNQKSAGVPDNNDVKAVKGWKLLDGSDEWKPCPIGVYDR